MNSHSIVAKLLILVALAKIRQIDIFKRADCEANMPSCDCLVKSESGRLARRIVWIDDLYRN